MSPRPNRAGIFGLLVIVLLCGPGAGPGFAQPLADRVPADALVYIGWAGSQEAAGYDQSHLKAVLDAWKPLEAMDEIVAAVMREQPDVEGAQEAWRQFRAVAPILYRRPTALYAGVSMDENNGEPRERLAILCRAGQAALTLEKGLRPLIDAAAASEPPIPPRLIVQGEWVALLIGKWTDAEVAKLGLPAPGAALSDQPDFQRAMRQVPIDRPAATLYFNGSQLLAMIDQMVRRGAEEAATWTKLRDAFALDGIKRVIWAGAFDGADWQSAAWIEAPSPRRGIAALLAAPALDPQVLAAAPQSATWLIATRFDLNQLWQLVRHMVRTIEPEADRRIELVLAQAQQMTGVQIEKQLIEPLGDQWLIYGEPTMATPFGPGAIVMNWARDGQALRASTDRLMQFANAMLQQQAQRPGQPRLSIQQMQADGATIYSLAFPFLSPALAVHDDKLYFALSPQTISMKLAMAKMQGNPITQHPAWKQVMAKLGDRPPQSVTFADLTQTAPVMLQSVASLAQIAQMGAPPDVNVMKLIPNLGMLMPHLGPVGQVAWSDETGIHSRSRGPFPLSIVLSPAGGTLSPGAVALGVGILLPSLSRARVVANRTVSATNLNSIYRAMVTYSITHDDKFPPDLGVLVADGSIGPKTVTNPLVTPRKDVPHGLNATDLGRWVVENSDYVYRAGKVGPKSGPNEIVAYERPTPELREGINILFGDGHVEFVPMERAKQLLREAGEPVPQ